MKSFYFALLAPIFLCNSMDIPFDDLNQEINNVKATLAAAIETCSRKIDECKLGISTLKNDMSILKVQKANLEKIKGVLDFIEVPDALDHYFNSPSKEKRNVAKLNFISYVSESSNSSNHIKRAKRRSVSARTIEKLQFGEDSDDVKNTEIIPITPRRMKTIDENSTLSDSSEKIDAFIRNEVTSNIQFNIGENSSSEEKAINKRAKLLRSLSQSSMENLLQPNVKKKKFLKKKNSFSYGNRDSVVISKNKDEQDQVKYKKNNFFGSKSHSSSNKKEKTTRKNKKKK